MKETVSGFYTLTYRFRLMDIDKNILMETKELYNGIVSFYCDLYWKHDSFQNELKGELLREMERMTIPSRDGTLPLVPLPFERVPVYFRRAAINSAIQIVKKSEASGVKQVKGQLSIPPVYYKGMYRDITPQQVSLKLWNGEGWKWYTVRLKGRPWPEEGRQMSPSIVLNSMQKKPMLHVPVQLENQDARKIREKMEAGADLCAVSFTNSDAFAVCSIVRHDGTFGASKFCKGGRQYSDLCRRTVDKIEKSKKSVGCTGRSKDISLNKKYWNYLKHLSEHYAHQVSSEIIDFCEENHVEILALPDYEEHYGSYVINKTDKWTSLYLSLKIRKTLEYKAWGKGISIAYVRYYKSGKKSAAGNPYLQTCRNIGRQCLKNHGIETVSIGKQSGNPDVYR